MSKKTIILLAAVCSFALASAQDQKTTAPSTQSQPAQGPKPEMMAMRHSKHLQKQLGLSEEQTTKVHDALLTRFTEVQSIREKAGANADKKALHKELKPVRQKFIAAMNGILTPEQKVKWDQHREQMKTNREKRNNTGNGTKPAEPANGDMKKLADDDDGLDN